MDEQDEADKSWKRLDQLEQYYYLSPEQEETIFNLQIRLERSPSLTARRELKLARKANRVYDRYRNTNSTADHTRYQNLLTRLIQLGRVTDESRDLLTLAISEARNFEADV